MNATSTTDTVTDAVAWTKPGPGSWELDSSHCGPAPSRLLRQILEESIPTGMREGLDLFGAPLSHMEMRWVHGKFYRRLVPIVGGDSDRKPPPPAVLKIASRLHPAFRKQEKKAKESFAVKRWRQELQRWETEWKPAIIATNLRLTDVDVASLDDAALADHLDEIWQHLRFTVPLHFRLHVSDMGPLGMLMVDLEDWGLQRDDTFRALVAASPAPREPAMKLRELAKAVPDAQSLDDVRAQAPELLDAYLRDHGWRLTTGYDIEDRCLVELPDVLFASIRAAAERGDASHDPAGALAALREQVPAQHRADFDESVEDARLSYGLRDENGPITYEWPGGLLRRAVLEAGRRLPLAAERDVFELDFDEITAWLRGSATIALDEIARRVEHRRWEATLTPPAQLGEDAGPPPVDVLPPNLARITRVILTVVDTLEASKDAASLTGMGIGSAPYVGTARVVHDAVEALAAMAPGDVVVAPYTAPTYNAVLSMAGAIVTEQGGLLCHAAVIARELELPAVIGCANAMSAIPDGATIEVDPVSGRVRVLA